ncbi:MarR family transcriptional regulator [Streptomyces sp. NPDC041003]|uniref:MarR family winged helix-turn-helix transcriptional regulator n=1 Tax=Streptomyces sp. NPDC041003 TaxID=3155730 RepID=UPI0033E5F413
MSPPHERRSPVQSDAQDTSLPAGTAAQVEPMVCAVINHVARLLSQAIADRLAELGVTLGQLPALLALYEQDGLTQSELARRTGVEQPTMAVNLRRMERDGLIARTPDPGDARRALVGLTPKAKSIREPVRQLRAGIDEDSLTGFTPAEHVQLRDFLARITGNLDTMLNARPKADPTGG